MRVDLHVHSRYSRRPSQWFLQKIGCPESFTEPLQIYRAARRKGMSHVTISDHNCIDGALEIAHLENAFISEELTAYFPQDGCKVHVLALNITEAQHRDLQKARRNIFELADYLFREGIVHVLAHPLYAINNRLTGAHFEQCLLLFKNFELNGARNDRENRRLERVVSSLTPEAIEGLSVKHGWAPSFPKPWRKNLVGGSDDHSSLTIARTYTEIEDVDDLRKGLERLESGEARAVRQPSTPLTMAHNLYGIAYQFYKNRFNLERSVNKDPLLRFLDRSLRAADDAEPGLFSRLYFFWNYRRQSKVRAAMPGTLVGLIGRETRKILRDMPEFSSSPAIDGNQRPPAEEIWFDFVNQTSNRVMLNFADHLMDHLAGANVFNLFHTLGSAGGLYTLMAPYFIAFSLFCQDRDLSRSLLEKFACREDVGRRPLRVAHFTDTFYEVNGVALTLQQHVRMALRNRKHLTLITCDRKNHPGQAGIRNFRPIGVYELPEYPEQKIFYPPLLEMLRFCYENDFNRINSATPGPIGLAALAIARILKIPISGTYHTQIPQYARFLTGDSVIEDLTWKYTLWYYDQMDRIYAPSRSTREELVARGIAPEKIHIYPRGIDIDRFRPEKRNGFFISEYGIEEKVKILYVGRLSKEKNLDVLQEAFKRLVETGADARLILVGDGPYLQEMRNASTGSPCTFTGYLKGESLCAAYASSDIFVFPSGTDTFGNVVLEAQASGLPVIVTDRGGPVENMVPDETGLVVPAEDAESLATAMGALVRNADRRRKMGAAARRYMEDRSFDAAFIRTWEMFRETGETAPANLAEAG